MSRPLPRSEYHERAAIGCMLEGYDDPVLREECFAHPGRQVLFMALRSMRDTCGLWTLKEFGSRHLARANGDRLCKVVMRTDLWDVAVKLPHEVSQCIEACTLPMMIDWHARSLGLLYVRRLSLMAAEQLSAAAGRPTADLRAVAEELAAASREAARLIRVDEAAARMARTNKRPSDEARRPPAANRTEAKAPLKTVAIAGKAAAG